MSITKTNQSIFVAINFWMGKCGISACHHHSIIPNTQNPQSLSQVTHQLVLLLLKILVQLSPTPPFILYVKYWEKKHNIEMYSLECLHNPLRGVAMHSVENNVLQMTNITGIFGWVTILSRRHRGDQGHCDKCWECKALPWESPVRSQDQAPLFHFQLSLPSEL